MQARLMRKSGLIIGALVCVSICAVILLAHKSDAGFSTPKDENDAKARVDWLCNQGVTIAHAAWISDISAINTNNGSLTYNTNVIWRRCTDGADTKAFAVTGYAGTDTAVCPDVGRYSGFDHTNDCVKYIGNPEYNRGNELSCDHDSNFNENCINGTFGSIKASKDQPETNFASDQIRHLPRSARIPDWPAHYNSSDTSYTFSIPDAVCAYWKKNSSDGGTPRINCQDINFKVTWQGKYTLTPSVTDLPPIIDGDTANATGAIANNGADSPSSTHWVMKLLAVSASNIPTSWSQTESQSSDSEPCAYFGGPGVSCTQLSESTESIKSSGLRRLQSASDVDRFPVGTRLCMTMSVQARARDDGRWQHAIQCATVGKKPKVQIIGSDVKVRQAIDGSGGSIGTSTTYSGGKHYGSWGEYGVMATGQISGIASGAGFAGGTSTSLNSCSLYLLTFANASAPNACKPSGSQGGFAMRSQGGQLLAYFTGGQPITAPVFDVSTATGIYTVDHNVKLIASRPISKAQWVVIKASNVAITIATDITYTSGSLPSAADIPQVLLFARTIAVEPSVGRVDSWLIADDTILTCNAVQKQADLTAKLCDTPLHINGPIVTKHLLLNRTAGAGVRSQSGNPAEVINLRADAYLWLQQHFQGNTRIRTVNEKELPPRF